MGATIVSLWHEARQAHRQRWVALWIAVVASIPRIWFALVEHPVGSFIVVDMAHYEKCADQLRQGAATVVNTFTPIGYPALLAFLFALTQKSYVVVAWTHVLLGSATAGLTHLIAFRLSRSFPVAVAASLSASLYFPLIFYAGLLLSETTFGFLVALSAWLCLRALELPTRRSRVGAGAAMAAAALVRANFVIAIPIVLAWGAVFDRDRKHSRFVPWTLAGVLPPLLAICLYNSALAGRPTGIATNGGVNFFLAHSDYTSVTFPSEDAIAGIAPAPNAVRLPAKAFETSAHAYDERIFYRLGLDELLRRPTRLFGDLQHVVDGFGLGRVNYWPGLMGRNDWLVISGWLLFAFCVIPSCLHLASIAFRPLDLAQHGARALLWGILGSMVVTLYLFLGDPRIRVPFDPLWMVLGADAWRGLHWRWLRLRARATTRTKDEPPRAGTNPRRCHGAG